MTKELKKYIQQEIPSNGEYWNSSTEQHMLYCAKTLLELGMKEEDVKEFLNDLYWSVADEFGGC